MFLKYKEQEWTTNVIPFLIRFYRWDLVAYRTKTIVTTKRPALNEYWNYYLNKYHIKTELPLLYDEQTERFYNEPDDLTVFERELSLRTEAKKIRDETPPDEISKYYR